MCVCVEGGTCSSCRWPLCVCMCGGGVRVAVRCRWPLCVCMEGGTCSSCRWPLCVCVCGGGVHVCKQ